jgi:hypothetical protein
MKRHIKSSIIIFLLLIICLLNSCKLAYVPSSVHVPLHENKGELCSQLSFGNNGLGLQASYSLTNEFAIMTSGQVIKDELLSHMSFDAAIGYFEKNEQNILFETFFGAGYGNAYRLPDQLNLTEHSQGEYWKFFIQPAIGLKPKSWETSIGLRTVYVNYSSIIFPERHNFNRLFFEPVITVKYGWEAFKFSLQGGGSIALGKLPPDLDFYPVFVNFGLQYTLRN